MVCVFSEGKRLVRYILQRSGNEWVNPPGGAVKVWLRTRVRFWEMADELPKRCGCTAGVNEALQKPLEGTRLRESCVGQICSGAGPVHL